MASRTVSVTFQRLPFFATSPSITASAEAAERTRALPASAATTPARTRAAPGPLNSRTATVGSAHALTCKAATNTTLQRPLIRADFINSCADVPLRVFGRLQRVRVGVETSRVDSGIRWL